MAKQQDNVSFIAVLADGSEHRFQIDKYTLRSGDHVARLIAREKQQAYQIPHGEIVSVRRA